jgi:hypothetical protein
VSPSRKKKTAHRFTVSPRSQLALVAGLVALAVFSWLEPYVWVGALVSELGFQIALIALAAAGFAAYRRALIAVAGLLAVAALFFWPLLPLYRATKPTPQAGPLLRVATAHLAGHALDQGALLSWLVRERPDAMALTGLREDIGGARLGPYRVARGSADLRTLLLVQSALVVPVRERAHPRHAVVTLRAGRCQARAVALELPPLSAYTALEARARAIREATGLSSTPRSVWLGHLGSRAEASDLRALHAAHALRDGRRGHGRLATAPGALGALGFPLSDVLVHGWISVREVDVKPPLVAGAHRTMTAVVELTEARCRFNRAALIE